MKEAITVYLQPVLIAAMFCFIIIRSCNDDANTEKNFRRDVMLEIKIDSLKSKIAGIDEKLVWVDSEISGSNKQITLNKNNYDKKKTELSFKPADSVYNWTKQRLHNRSK